MIIDQVSLADLDDQELIQLWKTQSVQDDQPFQELVYRYQSIVWRVCYSSLRNHEDAEDMTQEVFLKVYRNLDSFEGRSSFKTWVYRIAINTCRNEIRHRNRRPQETAVSIEDMADFLPSPITMDNQWQTRSQQEQLAQALIQLRPEEYEILRLKDIEERPYADVTNILGIGLSAAKMRAQRARQALQRSYIQLAGDRLAV